MVAANKKIGRMVLAAQSTLINSRTPPLALGYNEKDTTPYDFLRIQSGFQLSLFHFRSTEAIMTQDDNGEDVWITTEL